MWTWFALDLPNIFPHWAQGKLFTSKCTMLKWLSLALFLEHAFLHSEQGKSLIPIWDLRCLFKAPPSANFLPQNSHGFFTSSFSSSVTVPSLILHPALCSLTLPLKTLSKGPQPSLLSDMHTQKCWRIIQTIENHNIKSQFLVPILIFKKSISETKHYIEYGRCLVTAKAAKSFANFWEKQTTFCTLYFCLLCQPDMSTGPGTYRHGMIFVIFSCPEQLNRWPCHWLTH